MDPLRRNILFGTLILSATCALPAQVSFSLSGSSRINSTGVRLGTTLVTVPDADGDGCDDFVCGAPKIGKVVLFSGRTGLEIDSVSGARDDFFGVAVATGDFNGDGSTDWAIGAPQLSGIGPGYVVIVTKARTRQRELRRPRTRVAQFGTRVASAGDVDNDGFDDLAVTSLEGNVLITDVISMRTQTPYFSDRRATVANGAQGVGDMDGDGFDDFVLCSDTSWSVVSGRTRRIVAGHPFQGPQRFGKAIAAGDFNGDGVRDLIFGAPGASAGGERGELLVYSGLTSELLMRRVSNNAGSEFGIAVAAADLDGDGRVEVFVGGPGDSFSQGFVSAYRYSRTNGEFIGAVSGLRSGEDDFGRTVAVGDLNDDGRPDLIVGAPTDSIRASVAGRIALYTSDSNVDPGDWLRYGVGCADGSRRLARLSVTGPVAIGRDLTFELRAVPSQAPGFLAFGADRLQTSLSPIGMPGCVLLTTPLVTVAASTGSGSASLTFAVPADPSLIDARPKMQWFVHDPRANALGWVTSNAVEIRVGGG